MINYKKTTMKLFVIASIVGFLSPFINAQELPRGQIEQVSENKKIFINFVGDDGKIRKRLNITNREDHLKIQDLKGLRALSKKMSVPERITGDLESMFTQGFPGTELHYIETHETSIHASKKLATVTTKKEYFPEYSFPETDDVELPEGHNETRFILYNYMGVPLYTLDNPDFSPKVDISNTGDYFIGRDTATLTIRTFENKVISEIPVDTEAHVYFSDNDKFIFFTEGCVISIFDVANVKLALREIVLPKEFGMMGQLMHSQLHISEDTRELTVSPIYKTKEHQPEYFKF